MGKRRRRLSKVAALAAAVAVTLVAAESRAEQFVLFDATFTYTWDQAVNAKPSKSHFYVNEGNFLSKQRPVNWTSPVNYRDGKVHIHLEVLEKPAGTQQAGWALCYVANAGDYGCPYTDYYKSVGAYEKDVDMHTFYNNTTIQWDKGVKQVDLVYTVNGSGSGHITNFPELKDLVTPTKVRIAMVQVSMGATYDPSILKVAPPVEPGADASAPPPRDAAAADGSADAGASTPDASSAPEVGAPSTGAAGATGEAGAGPAGAGAAGEGAAGAGGVGGGGAAGTPAPPATGGAGMNGSTGGTGVSPGGHVASGGCRVAGHDAGGGGPPLAAGATVIVLAALRRRRRS